MKFSLSLIGMLYVIILGSLCHILSIPEIIKGFLALPAFLIIPILVGDATSLLLKKIIDIRFNFDVISKGIVSWCIGLISIVVIALFMNAIHLFNAKMYVVLILSLMAVGTFYRKNLCQETNKKTLLFNSFNVRIAALLSISIGIIMAIFISYFSPYPLFYGLDAFNHNLHTLYVLEDDYISSWGIYIPTISILISIPAVIFNMSSNPFPIFWIMKFLLFPLFSLGLYLYFYQISKNIKLSLIGALMGPWIIIMASGVYNFIPRIVFYVIFPFLLFLIHKNIINSNSYLRLQIRDVAVVFFLLSTMSLLLFIIIFFMCTTLHDSIGFILPIYAILVLMLIKISIKNGEVKRIFSILFLAVMVILLIQSAMGVLGVSSIILYLVISFSVKRYPKKTRILIYIFALSIFIFLFLQYIQIISLQWGIINLYNVPYYPTPEFFTYYQLLIDSYGSLILLLSLIGVIFAFFRNRSDELCMLFVSSAIILIYFLPIAEIYRILLCVTPFIVYFASSALMEGHSLFLRNARLLKHRRYRSVFYFTLVIIILIPLMMTPYMTPIKSFSQWAPDGYFTLFGYNEYQTGEWIKFNTKKETLVITDPRTQIITIGLSNRMGIARNDESQKISNIVDILSTTDAYHAYNELKGLLNKTIVCNENDLRCNNQNFTNMSEIIVISGRVSDWIKYYNKGGGILHHNFEYFNGFDKFFNTTYFTLLYNNSDQIYIFGVNPEPGVPFKLVNNSKS